MREMIDQLESERVGVNDENNNVNSEQLQKMRKKTVKKLKHKEVQIKSKEKQMEELKDELNKVKLTAINMEQKIRESTTKQQEAEERVKYYSYKLKEVELEKDLVLAEKNNALENNDLSSQQVEGELNSLRECFARLKVERDHLLYEIEGAREKEGEWRKELERMNTEMNTMEKHLLAREKE